MEKEKKKSYLKKLYKITTFIISIGILVFAIHLLAKHFGHIRFQDFVKSLENIPTKALLIASAFSILNYLVLGALEIVSHRFAQTELRWWRALMIGSSSYALINTVGFSSLFGTAIRYHYYSRWKIQTLKFFKAVSFAWFSYWLGMGVIIAAVFLISPGDMKTTLADHASLKYSALVILILIVIYFYSVLTQKKLFIGKRSIAPPSRSIAFFQLILGMADWITAGVVLYAILPDGAVTLFTFFRVFMLAQALGLASHVPAGLGVFESIMLTGLDGHLDTATLMACIAAYRTIYYLIPLCLALVGMLIIEMKVMSKKLKNIKPPQS